jgi:hypothetical protein
MCTNLSYDQNNCGVCGNVCTPPDVCTNGVCGCPYGMQKCSGQCVDITFDTNNCGGCGNVCTPPDVCANGVCGCPVGMQKCNGQCVNITYDANNCGGCGNVCTGGKVCQSGTCSCQPGELTCSGQCTNINSDPGNCGGCGNACTNGLQCLGGQCICPSGWSTCSGSCTNVLGDPQNCGTCGTVCTSDQVCTNGNCQCPFGSSVCNGLCTATQTDPANCGGCGISCGGLDCVGGSCGCAPGKTNCSNQCADLQSDPGNCGACGTACTSGQVCVAGGCMSASCVLFEEDFSDNSQGWTLGTEWAIGPTKVSSGQSAGFPDPAYDHTGTSDNNVAGVVLGGNSSQTAHDFYFLTSPVVDASSATNGLLLSFYRWLNADYPPYMYSEIDVYDGTKWVKVWEVLTSPGPTDSSWQAITIDLSSYVNDKLRVRFGFKTSSGVYAVSNWNVDDVKLIKKSCN